MVQIMVLRSSSGALNLEPITKYSCLVDGQQSPKHIWVLPMSKYLLCLVILPLLCLKNWSVKIGTCSSSPQFTCEEKSHKQEQEGFAFATSDEWLTDWLLYLSLPCSYTFNIRMIYRLAIVSLEAEFSKKSKNASHFNIHLQK